jgi:Pyruvate/2-oxoacid:ferredoxin oxidoreductase delta subunit
VAARKIVRIDADKCDGCGLCATACHEGAIAIVDGKARLVSETYCDGLGDCLGECPRDAITIEEREASAFDAQAVERHIRSTGRRHDTRESVPRPGGCPGSAVRDLGETRPTAGSPPAGGVPSQLGHWPIQITLVPPEAPFLRGADILVAADCVPFAFPGFHSRYLGGRALLVGCPKLDDLEFYRGKLRAMFAAARPRSVTVLRMEVPCCGGLAHAVASARDEAIPGTPIEVVTIGIKGSEVRRELVEGRS